VIHISYTPANVDQVYFPHAEVVGDVGPSLELLADRLEGKLPNAGALLSLRDGILNRIADRNTEDRWPPTPQRIVHDVRQVIPPDGIVALDLEAAELLEQLRKIRDAVHAGSPAPHLRLVSDTE